MKTAKVTVLKNSYKLEFFRDGERVARNYLKTISSVYSFCAINGYELIEVK